MQFSFGARQLDLSKPHVMGILNVTPDSFYDGGRYFDANAANLGKAVSQAEAMVSAGATLVDIGGESTRPGAAPVGEQEEMDRVLPVVEALGERLDVVISVDTSTPALMREAAARGAGLINDVRALQQPGALAAAAESGLPVCLMHMQGQPGAMQHNPRYTDVVGEVCAFLRQRLRACQQAGIDAHQILLDPGFGFGKTDAHNIALLGQLEALASLGCPLLVGLSRKSLIGRLLGRELPDRLPASLALALIAVQHGARIVRVHDVAETVDAVKIFQYVNEGSNSV